MHHFFVGQIVIWFHEIREGKRLLDPVDDAKILALDKGKAKIEAYVKGKRRTSWVSTDNLLPWE